MSSYELARQSQFRWARERGLILERPGYVAAVSGNLFAKDLNPRTKEEFTKGDGSELRDSGARPAKMRALLSSSALAANFFDPWRNTDLAPLAAALGTSPLHDLEFEHKCSKYPVGPRSPNLDLLFHCTDGTRIGVECKFTEPYAADGFDSALSLRYFPVGDGLWTENGLPGVQRVANEMRGCWDHVDCPQLLKHILGLRCETPLGKVRLYCVWFETPLADSHALRTELERFADLVNTDDVSFAHISYQELFRRLREDEPSPGWSDYMQSRYFDLSTGS